MAIWTPASPTFTQATRMWTLLRIVSSLYRSRSYTEHRPLVARPPRPRPPSTWPGLLISIYSVPASIASSLRAGGGAMALLCGHVDADTIRLVGRWKSDTMFRYLHAQALPLVRHLAHTMLTHGAFSLLPGSDLPLGAPSLPTHPP